MRFDTHAHIFKENVGIANARYIPDYSVSKEDFIDNLESHSFNGGVLIQPSFLGHDNSLLLRAVEGDSRLRGVVVLPFNTNIDALQSYAKSGIVGVRLNLIGADINALIDSLSSSEAKSFFNSLQKLNWHVEVHREMRDIDVVIESLLHFDIKVVIDHLGRPSIDKNGNDLCDEDSVGLEKLKALKTDDRLWFKVSGFYRFGGNEEQNLALARLVYTELLSTFGIDKFVFGSDFPHTNFESIVSYKNTLESFYKVVLNSKEREAILGENAKVLFGF